VTHRLKIHGLGIYIKIQIRIIDLHTLILKHNWYVWTHVTEQLLSKRIKFTKYSPKMWVKNTTRWNQTSTCHIFEWFNCNFLKISMCIPFCIHRYNNINIYKPLIAQYFINIILFECFFFTLLVSKYSSGQFI